MEGGENDSPSDNLFSICSRILQVDGTFGVSATLMKMLLQSHEQALHVRPALPDSWAESRREGGLVVFESTKGGTCLLRPTQKDAAEEEE